MKLLFRLITFALVAILAAAACNAQSLGDVARQEKAKKGVSSSAAKTRTLTNDDIAPSSAGTAADAPAEDSAAPEKKADTPKSREAAAAQFKTKIKQQKVKVNVLELHVKDVQKGMDRWKNSDCTHVLKADGSNVCDRLQNLTAELDRAKGELDKARAGLTTLQDNARKAGFGVQVYDPE